MGRTERGNPATSPVRLSESWSDTPRWYALAGSRGRSPGPRYDLNGNLTSDGTSTYTWNARGQLTTIAAGTTTAAHAYGLGLVSILVSISVPSMRVPIAVMPAVLPIFFWCFALGMLLAVIERDHPTMIRSRLWLAIGAPLIVVGLVYADGYPAGYGDPGATLLVVLGAVVLMGGVMRWRQQWAWAALGADTSYSFHLWHYPILNALVLVMTPAAAVALGFAITGVISLVTTMALERPVRRWVDSRQRAGAPRAQVQLGARTMVPIAEP